jgi:hypothetical protein
MYVVWQERLVCFSSFAACAAVCTVVVAALYAKTGRDVCASRHSTCLLHNCAAACTCVVLKGELEWACQANSICLLPGSHC